MRGYLNLLRRFSYWGLPFLILYIVFQRIDLNEFEKAFAQTNAWLVLLGITFRPLVMLIGALRWNLLARQYNRTEISWSYTLKHYWIGLALGIFVPGSVGWDIYRVVAIGRRFGHYMLNMSGILVEKFVALSTCVSFIIVLYPFITLSTPSSLIQEIITVAYIVFLGSVLFLGCLVLLKRSTWGKQILKRIEQRISAVLQDTARRIRPQNTREPIKIPLQEILYPLVMPRYLFPVIGLSFAIQFVSALGSQIFFLGVGYDLPFIVNLFATPIFYFIFVLPISFGSLGVREATYIIMFGLFGVPVETALIVSFCSLSGLLLNYGIGGLLILLHRDLPTRTTVRSQGVTLGR